MEREAHPFFPRSSSLTSFWIHVMNYRLDLILISADSGASMVFAENFETSCVCVFFLIVVRMRDISDSCSSRINTTWNGGCYSFCAARTKAASCAASHGFMQLSHSVRGRSCY